MGLMARYKCLLLIKVCAFGGILVLLHWQMVKQLLFQQILWDMSGIGNSTMIVIHWEESQCQARPSILTLTIFLSIVIPVEHWCLEQEPYNGRGVWTEFMTEAG